MSATWPLLSRGEGWWSSQRAHTQVGWLWSKDCRIVGTSAGRREVDSVAMLVCAHSEIQRTCGAQAKSNTWCLAALCVCAAGIVNVMKDVQQQSGKPPYAVFGGEALV